MNLQLFARHQNILLQYRMLASIPYTHLSFIFYFWIVCVCFLNDLAKSQLNLFPFCSSNNLVDLPFFPHRFAVLLVRLTFSLELFLLMKFEVYFYQYHNAFLFPTHILERANFDRYATDYLLLILLMATQKINL